MKNFDILFKWILSALSVVVVSYVLTGVMVESFTIALVVAAVLAVFNMIVRPILIFLTLPFTIVTLGLFLFVINGLIVWLAAELVPGFAVASIWWAIGFAALLAILNAVIEKSFGKKGM